MSLDKRRYSDPQLFIPRKNGKPSVEKGKRWYVYFYWRSDPNGPLDKKYTYSSGINWLDSAQERRSAGMELREVIRESLQRGWNPQTKSIGGKAKRKPSQMTLERALEFAYNVKLKASKKTPTLTGYEFHKNRFLAWAKDNGYLGMEIKRFDIDHFYEFLDYLRFDYVKDDGSAMSGTSVNNHKRSLSALFTTLKNERIIKDNFIKGIPQFEQEPTNNKAFTLEEISKIKGVVARMDPYLLPIIAFILYPLLRPREVCRLTAGDIDLKNGILGVETKTEKKSFRRIIKKLEPFLEEMDLESLHRDEHLFTSRNRPGVWEVPLKAKVDHFGKRFRKIKKELGFGREYGLYSFRHTAIMDLFYSFQKQGFGEEETFLKLLPYTQHKSVAGVKNYVRKHERTIPSDHSDIYTLDF